MKFGDIAGCRVEENENVRVRIERTVPHAAGGAERFGSIGCVHNEHLADEGTVCFQHLSAFVTNQEGVSGRRRRTIHDTRIGKDRLTIWAGYQRTWRAESCRLADYPLFRLRRLTIGLDDPAADRRGA